MLLFCRNHCAPTQAGIYNVMFVYFDGKHEVYSSVVSTKQTQKINFCSEMKKMIMKM